MRALNDLLICWDINNRALHRISGLGMMVEMCKEKKINTNFCYSSILAFILSALGVISKNINFQYSECFINRKNLICTFS